MDVQHNLEQNGSAFLLQDLQDLQSLPDGIDADESYPLQPRGRQKPPLVLWRLTLLVGDGIVLLLALVLFLLIAPLFNLGLHIELDDTTKWSIRLVWGGIALISWSIAVTILQAQEMRRASNRFKSPLLAVAALVMMLALWLLLIYPFIANRFTTYLAATLVFIAIAIPLLGAWRVVLADCMNLPRFRPHGVIIGTSAAGEAITSELLAAKRQAVSIQGYISEDKERGTYRGGLPILGGKGAIRHLVQQHLIDTIIIADAYHVTPALVHAAMDAVQFGVSVIPMTVVYENAFG
ncbi:MAG TPA: hypothetical protein VGU68_13170, partial [Ktedonobacteraceae bacterium]|nr:hypothetical protein [Ktedonobacteraceae bacterium]